jgi:hypothetical protein
VRRAKKENAGTPGPLRPRTADRLGGTGRTHDRSISARVVAAVALLPVYRAGGGLPGRRDAA